MQVIEADVAQLVEQPIRNRQVTGSSPVVGSIRLKICISSTGRGHSVPPHNNWLAIPSSGAPMS
jgi:hypothetical protein